jgi:hypothetical protein
MTIVASGVGVSIGIFSRAGAITHVDLTTATPVDAERADLRSSVWTTETNAMGLETIEQQHAEFEKDIVIWEAMQYMDRPPFVPEEAKAFQALRRWASQFYVDGVDLRS